MFVVRTGPSVILELTMTIALFYIMHLLIAVTYVLVPPAIDFVNVKDCLLYTSPSPRDATLSRKASSA